MLKRLIEKKISINLLFYERLVLYTQWYCYVQHQPYIKLIILLISLKQCFDVTLFLQVVKTNQFSVTRHEKVANGLIGDQGLPGVFVLYELSPMMVKFTEKHR